VPSERYISGSLAGMGRVSTRRPMFTCAPSQAQLQHRAYELAAHSQRPAARPWMSRSALRAAGAPSAGPSTRTCSESRLAARGRRRCMATQTRAPSGACPPRTPARGGRPREASPLQRRHACNSRGHRDCQGTLAQAQCSGQARRRSSRRLCTMLRGVTAREAAAPCPSSH